MRASASGGTLIISHPPPPTSCNPLDYDMGLVRVSKPFSAAQSSPAPPPRAPSLQPHKKNGFTSGGIAVMSPNKLPFAASARKTNENGGGGGGGLKRLLVDQLDLIRKQSEAIVARDRQLRELKLENRNLQMKLAKFEGFEVVEPPPRKKPKTETSVSTKDKSVETTSELLDGFELKSAASKAKADKRKQRPWWRRRLLHGAFVESAETYFTLQGEEFRAAEEESVRAILAQSEVPKWRVLPQPRWSSSAAEEAVEDMDDETFERRHVKPETQEKKLKRWDMQRLRQQKQVERLRARYDALDDQFHHLPPSSSSSVAGPASSSKAVSSGESDVGCGGDKTQACIGTDHNGSGWTRTFHPDPGGASHVFVGDCFPVSAFGCALPELSTSDSNKGENFALPWLSHQNPQPP